MKREKIIKLIALTVLFLLPLTLSWIWFTWKLPLILLLLWWGINYEQHIKDLNKDLENIIEEGENISNKTSWADKMDAKMKEKLADKGNNKD